MNIRSFEPRDTEAIVELWRQCNLLRPWNDPHKDIARKRAVRGDWFLVGELDGRVVASAMVGYDGHRGWLYYLAVSPDLRNQGLGRAIVEHAEALLLAAGCPKINLQVRGSNTGVFEFYRVVGFSPDDVVSLGKRLIPDV